MVAIYLRFILPYMTTPFKLYMNLTRAGNEE